MFGTRAELFRYLLNGAAATGAHFAVLTTNVEVLGFESVGLANFVAAILGSMAAFLGNRYLVFRNTGEPAFRQLSRFSGLYVAMACVHGLALFIWCDLCKWNYAQGFVIATSIQVFLGYLGNRLWVFRT